MERAEIAKRVNKILEEEFEVDGSLLTIEAKLYEDLDLDSLDAVDLIVALERDFGVTIDRKDTESKFSEIRALSDVYDFVESTLG